MFKQEAILKFDLKVESLFCRKEGNTLSFDTYFNSFNVLLLKYFKAYSKLTIKTSFEGTGSVAIIHQTKDKKEVLFKSELLIKNIEIDITKIPQNGMIFPVFSGNFDIKALSYEIDCESDKTSISVIFTTFNRQDFLIPNLYKLDTCKLVDNVVIVDNAKNLVLPKDLSPKKFVVVANDNLGGSGGFTRGMIEAKKLGSTHFFIMDDDITLIPEVVDKAISLISCLNKKHKRDWLGFSMLPNEHPTTQFEFGTVWNGVRMRLNGHNLDLSKKENLFKNQVNTKYNYSAWWSLIMPSSVLDEHGYPFPFFIKFDDIEYGLRRTGEEIILTNGFGVWHEDFDKKFNPYLEYYLFRNALVTNAFHDKKPLYHSLKRFFFKNIKWYFKFHHKEMELMNLGVDDFLKGPEFFLNLNIEENNKRIRELAKKKVNPLKGVFVNPILTCVYLFKIMFKFNKAKHKYVSGIDMLTSESYWKGVFKDAK